MAPRTPISSERRNVEWIISLVIAFPWSVLAAIEGASGNYHAVAIGLCIGIILVAVYFGLQAFFGTRGDIEMGCIPIFLSITFIIALPLYKKVADTRATIKRLRTQSAPVSQVPQQQKPRQER